MLVNTVDVVSDSPGGGVVGSFESSDLGAGN